MSMETIKKIYVELYIDEWLTFSGGSIMDWARISLELYTQVRRRERITQLNFPTLECLEWAGTLEADS